jgi:predicted nucleotidyltransferase/DNA-binding transcriptional ArsR family regulator
VPIDIERFESAAGPDEPTTSERIVQFLLEHEDRAFTRGEIADAIDVNPETVGTNLTRLKARGLVRHREPYWAFTDDHEQARAVLRERGADDLVALLSEPARDGSPEIERGTQKASTGPDSDRPHRLAASAFTDRVRDQLGEAIDACYVFGSVARRTETATSDVDILVVIADEAEFRDVDDRLLDIAFDVQLEYDVSIEVHSLRASEFEARRDRGEPFVRKIVEEGVTSD